MSVFQMLTSRCISARFASSVARPLPGSAATAEVNQGEERDQQSSQEAITPTSFAATEKEACSSKAGEGEVKELCHNWVNVREYQWWLCEC